MNRNMITTNLNHLLLKRRERTRLTTFSWLIITCIVGVFFLIVIREAHPFLSINQPIKATILIVEGHIPDYLIDTVKKKVELDNYTMVFTTGTTLIHGQYLCGYSNYADLTAASLVARGVNPSIIESVPCSPKQRDRTYESAMALKNRLDSMNIRGGKLNIFTYDTHARRTLNMFKKALGNSWEVGVFSANSLDYDKNRWWQSSYGVRAVVYESLAWLYTTIFFQPDEKKKTN